MEKTEEPTPKRLREARQRGEVPRSGALGGAAVVLAATGVLFATAEAALGSLRSAWDVSLSAISGTPSAGPSQVLVVAAGHGLDALVPVLLAVVAAATLSGFLQVGPLLTLQAVSPEASRVDPSQGLKRLFSQRQAMELLRTLATLLVTGAVAWITIEQSLRGIVGLAARDAEAALVDGAALVGRLLLRVGAAMAVLAVLDVLYQRWRHHQDQKMTRDEVKREQREAEGDPQTKQHRERTHRELAGHASLEEVRRADVLMVDGDRLAVALRYAEAEGMVAPEVTAKGQEELARRMTDAARSAEVPVLFEGDLARSLDTHRVGDPIGEALYEPVALALPAAGRERDEGGKP